METLNGIACLFNGRGNHWFLTSGSSHRGVFVGAEHLPGTCSSISFGMPTTLREQRVPRLTPTCGWQFMISSARYLRRPDPWPTSRHADRLFARIRNVVM